MDDNKRFDSSTMLASFIMRSTASPRCIVASQRKQQESADVSASTRLPLGDTEVGISLRRQVVLTARRNCKEIPVKSRELKGRRIAVLATDGFEKVELTIPVMALRAAGAKVDVVSIRRGAIRGVNLHEPASRVRVNKTLNRVDV